MSEIDEEQSFSVRCNIGKVTLMPRALGKTFGYRAELTPIYSVYKKTKYNCSISPSLLNKFGLDKGDKTFELTGSFDVTLRNDKTRFTARSSRPSHIALNLTRQS